MNDPEDSGGHRRGLAGIADEQSVPVDVDHLQRVAERALAALGVSAELSIALVDIERIQALKAGYYGVDASTDVLSFPMDGPQGRTLGDVVICPAFAGRQARSLGIGLGQEMAQLLVHGILHLCGHGHESPSEEIAMAGKERTILRIA